MRKVFFFFLRFYLFLDRGEGREKERERKINVWYCLSHPPHWGPGLQPRCVPWLGIEPVTLWFTGWHSTTEPHQPGQQISFKWYWMFLFLDIREGREKERERNCIFFNKFLYLSYYMAGYLLDRPCIHRAPMCNVNGWGGKSGSKIWNLYTRIMCFQFSS